MCDALMKLHGGLQGLPQCGKQGDRSGSLDRGPRLVSHQQIRIGGAKGLRQSVLRVTCVAGLHMMLVGQMLEKRCKCIEAVRPHRQSFVH